MILDLVFAMTDCHMQKHKMHKKDVVVMQNRLQNTFMDQTFILNENLATRYKMKKELVKNLEKTHVKLYYGTVLESVIVILLSIGQVVYLRRILENKQII